MTVPIEILDDVDIDIWGILIDFPKEPDFLLDSSDIQAATSFGEGLYFSSFQALVGWSHSSASIYFTLRGSNQVLLKLDKSRKLRTGRENS